MKGSGPTNLVSGNCAVEHQESIDRLGTIRALKSLAWCCDALIANMEIVSMAAEEFSPPELER
jgi:hypothetical protein